MATLKAPVNDLDHIQGNIKAACTLVEYGDYECPHCGAAYPLVKQIQKHFGSKLRFIFRNFPLTNIHVHAQAAAEVAELAGSNGQFWEMHDLLFENQDRLGNALFVELDQELKIDATELQKALDDKTFAAHVRADFSGGVRSGVNGTPTFFIDNQRHDGPMDYSTIVAKIEAALAS
jgi:protein-disulfide isomerase